MCFGGSADRDDVEGANKSREIDKLIRQDEKKMAREVKLLLLGEYRYRALCHHIHLMSSQC
jgi:guanine nucleotide-binding protein subunit alpha, other